MTEGNNYCWALNQHPTEKNRRHNPPNFSSLWTAPVCVSHLQPSLGAELKMPEVPSVVCHSDTVSPELSITSATGWKQGCDSGDSTSLLLDLPTCSHSPHCTPAWLLLLLPPEKCKAASDPLGFLWRAQKMGLKKGVRQQADVLY